MPHVDLEIEHSFILPVSAQESLLGAAMEVVSQEVGKYRDDGVPVDMGKVTPRILFVHDMPGGKQVRSPLLKVRVEIKRSSLGPGAKLELGEILQEAVQEKFDGVLTPLSLQATVPVTLAYLDDMVEYPA
jgi:hypothetical protein